MPILNSLNFSVHLLDDDSFEILYQSFFQILNFFIDFYFRGKNFIYRYLLFILDNLLHFFLHFHSNFLQTFLLHFLYLLLIDHFPAHFITEIPLLFLLVFHRDFNLLFPPGFLNFALPSLHFEYLLDELINLI